MQMPVQQHVGGVPVRSVGPGAGLLPSVPPMQSRQQYPATSLPAVPQPVMTSMPGYRVMPAQQVPGSVIRTMPAAMVRPVVGSSSGVVASMPQVVTKVPYKSMTPQATVQAVAQTSAAAEEKPATTEQAETTGPAFQLRPSVATWLASAPQRGADGEAAAAAPAKETTASRTTCCLGFMSKPLFRASKAKA
eukprot:TRINITY_DN72913_c0_g1_i1.p1 TRINITY_DN72913_c0_g1~~TRINITY_DN72913_c0_g1_i1.p1  ORF type:complete len:218 (-),score=51.59 TRINITY_DN72913_c0_g1_i1:58-630(-)